MDEREAAALPEGSVPARVENARFFGDRARGGGPLSVPERVFYDTPRPPPEESLAAKAALTPLRFGLVLLLVGWAGILFQRSFLQQVVFGAPVFEEMAKVGLPIVAVALLRIRAFWPRLLLAWASGAGFGLFEHVSTYAGEEVFLLAGRVAFHAGATGLSMAFYHAFEHMGDVRTRWASTAVSTLLHWANNFMAVVFAFAALPFPFLDVVALGWASVVTVAILALTLLILVAKDRFLARSRRVLREVVPRLGLTQLPAEADAPARLPPPPLREPPGG